MVQSHVTARIKARMAYLDKNQGDLAEVLGVTRQAVSRRLLGVTPIDIDELDKIARYLGVSMSDLLGEAQASA